MVPPLPLHKSIENRTSTPTPNHQTCISLTLTNHFRHKTIPLEITKITQSLSDGDKNKQLDRELRDIVNTITNGLAKIHKLGASHYHLHRDAADEDGQDVRIIMLAGTNTGATMRSELDEKTNKPLEDESDALGTYVNNNFQVVNNSIMLESQYTTNDPGVHVEISDTFENPSEKKADKQGKKGNKKDKETFKSDDHSDKSD